MMIGSLNTYTKNLKMQAQFELKQRNGDFSSHKSLEEWLGESTSTGSAYEDLVKEHGDKQLKSIYQKLDAGAKLTAEERRYLQAKDPEAYAKMKATEQEQKAFEQKLKQCKTKEEAQRLKMTYLNASLVTVKAVEHNPNIGLSKKLEIMMQEKRRCDKLEQSAREFVRRGDYGRLPTEAEEAKARKDAQEANRPQPAGEPQDLPAEKTAPKEKEPEEKEKIHVESAEEKKVKRAKNKARANSRDAGAEYAAAVAAYQSAQTTTDSAQPNVDVKG